MAVLWQDSWLFPGKIPWRFLEHSLGDYLDVSLNVSPAFLWWFLCCSRWLSIWRSLCRASENSLGRFLARSSEKFLRSFSMLLLFVSSRSLDHQPRSKYHWKKKKKWSKFRVSVVLVAFSNELSISLLNSAFLHKRESWSSAYFGSSSSLPAMIVLSSGSSVSQSGWFVKQLLNAKVDISSSSYLLRNSPMHLRKPNRLNYLNWSIWRHSQRRTVLWGTNRLTDFLRLKHWSVYC